MPQRFVIESGSVPERLDKALSRLLPETSRSTVQRWIEEGRVSVGGRPARSRDSVGPGAVIEVEPGPPLPSAAEPDGSVVLSVVFEDEHLLVIDKPAGLVVHPARGHRSGTLVNGLLARPGFQAPPADERDPASNLRPGIVHRIDKDTSGLLVVAKSEAVREGLKAELAARRMQRRYQALTFGVPAPGVISTLHGRSRFSRLRYTSRVREGKPAVTHVAVLERLAGNRAALVQCRLETGRTHQIRVHLTEQAKTPLVGDPLYGRPPEAPELSAIASTLARQALHAALLGFTHPITGHALCFEAPPPADFLQALEALRALRA